MTGFEMLAFHHSYSMFLVVLGEWDGLPVGVLVFYHSYPALLLSLGMGWRYWWCTGISSFIFSGVVVPGEWNGVPGVVLAFHNPYLMKY